MATYYIDFENGDNTNSGTSEGNAWLQIPGTRNVADTDDAETSWGSGTISTSNKVQPGDVFRIKPGTTYDSSVGGKILIDTDYYSDSATVENPITFIAYQAWSGASGSITFDGTGITTGGIGFGIFQVSLIGGFNFDGQITDGFIFQNSPNGGICQYTTSTTEGISVSYSKFYNNQTAISGDQASASCIELWNADGGVIDHCEFDGNDQARSGLGLRIGEDGARCLDITVSNCVGHGFYGTDDGGMAFKAFNSNVTYTNCIGYNCYKGFDLGEQGSTDTWDFTYKLVNCESYENNFGVNFNCGNVDLTGTVNFYLINSIVRDNSEDGSNIYAGPYNLYIVHSIYDGNDANLKVGPEIPAVYTDETQIRVYIYNSIFYKPTGDYTNLGTSSFINDTTNFQMDNDYNSYAQYNTELFYAWDYIEGGGANKEYHYGSTGNEGPGNTSREWYTEYSDSTTPPTNSNGHYHCDANSKGTGCDDTTLPPFIDIGSNNYFLTETYAGTDLSGKGWYIDEMGVDRNGNTRTNWDIGIYEYVVETTNCTSSDSILGGEQATIVNDYTTVSCDVVDSVLDGEAAAITYITPGGGGGVGYRTFTYFNRTPEKKHKIKKPEPKPNKRAAMAFQITSKDRENIAQYIKEELKRRKTSKFRKESEANWERIDRQVAMEPPLVIMQSEVKQKCNQVQPGHLADAVEIDTQDALRLCFPQDRKWFQPHIDLGRKVEPRAQRMADGVLRSFMVQQHIDFSLKDRCKLLFSEALKHGSFAGEIRWCTMLLYPQGNRIKTVEAPVIQPFSMWNTYPDPSPELVGTDLFYRGSMIITSKVRKSEVKKHPQWKYRGDPRNPNDMVDIIYFYGTVVVPRSRSDEFIPNRKVVIVEDELVYSEVNELDYPSIIYGGYERMDVRSPYYTSPIIKRGPTMTAATIALNDFLDAVDLRNFPPTIEDTMVDGEIELVPGYRNKVQGGGQAVNVINIGDPQAALSAMQVLFQHIERGVGDERKLGVAPSTELTATGEMRLEQRSEVKASDFVSTFERQALLPFLYMQHALNKKRLGTNTYQFFNDELNTPDFMRMTQGDLPNNVLFEVTGSKTVLGEMNRAQRFQATAGAILGNPHTLALSNIEAILQQAWQDTGIKDPERFVVPQPQDQQQQMVQQAVQQVQQQAQQQIAQLQQQLAQAQANVQVQSQRAQAEFALKQQRQQAELQMAQAEAQRKDAIAQEEAARKDAEARATMTLEDQKVRSQIAREDALIKEKIRLLQLQAQQDSLRAQQQDQRTIEREKRTEASKQKEEPKKEAQVINIVSHSGGKRISIEEDHGRITGATVQPINSDE